MQQAVRTHATLLDDRLGPGQRLGTDVFGFTEQNGFVGRLPCWSMERPVLGLGGVAAWLHTQVERHQPTLTVSGEGVDAHQVAIPLGAHLLADERVRHRVEGAVDLDVSVGMDAASTDLEQLFGASKI